MHEAWYVYSILSIFQYLGIPFYLLSCRTGVFVVNAYIYCNTMLTLLGFEGHGSAVDDEI